MLSRIVLFVSVISGLLIPPTSEGQEQDLISPTDNRARIEAWVQTSQLISRESTNWARERQTLVELNHLRAQEIEQLKEFIDAAGERVDEVAKQRANFASDEKELKSWRRKLELAIDDFEARLLPLIPRFPPPLREKSEESLLRLEASAPGRPLQQRTRDVLLVLQAFLEFQNNLTLDGDVREIDGEKREIDVLYLGLSQSWWVDSTGRYGGIGHPGDDGWEWQEIPSLAPRIRRTIDIQSKTLPPEFIRLPIQTTPDSE